MTIPEPPQRSKLLQERHTRLLLQVPFFSSQLSENSAAYTELFRFRASIHYTLVQTLGGVFQRSTGFIAATGSRESGLGSYIERRNVHLQCEEIRFITFILEAEYHSVHLIGWKLSNI